MDIGVVHYTMRPEGGYIDAIWHTTRLNDTRCGTGVARGDTSNGFEGKYEITYFYPNGEVSAELDLEITKEDDRYSLTYSKAGKTLLIGIGLETPCGLAAGYRKLE